MAEISPMWRQVRVSARVIAAGGVVRLKWTECSGVSGIRKGDAPRTGGPRPTAVRVGKTPDAKSAGDFQSVCFGA